MEPKRQSEAERNLSRELWWEEHRLKVWLGLVGIVGLLGAAFLEYDRTRLSREGVQAPAVITSVRLSQAGDSPGRYGQFALRITPEAGAPITAHWGQQLSTFQLQQFTEGAHVIVLYHPEQKAKGMILSLDKRAYPQGSPGASTKERATPPRAQ